MLTENQHTVKVHTQKGICGTVLTVQFLPSGEQKYYDHVLTFNLQILSTFQVNNLMLLYAYIICVQVESNRWEFSRKISDPFNTKTPDSFNT